MILKRQFGKHTDVLFAEFGSGGIKMTKGRDVSETHENMLMFYNQNPPQPVGSLEGPLPEGLTTDDVDAPEVVFVFNNPESITALIHSLIELQKEVFAKCAENKPQAA